MIVSELIEQLRAMPLDTVVVSAKDPNGAWTLIGKDVLRVKYEGTDVCILSEG